MMMMMMISRNTADEAAQAVTSRAAFQTRATSKAGRLSIDKARIQM
jgi:hypothetical protein